MNTQKFEEIPAVLSALEMSFPDKSPRELDAIEESGLFFQRRYEDGSFSGVFADSRIDSTAIIEPGALVLQSRIHKGAKIKKGAFVRKSEIGPDAEVQQGAAVKLLCELKKGAIVKKGAYVENRCLIKEGAIVEGRVTAASILGKGSVVPANARLERTEVKAYIHLPGGDYKGTCINNHNTPPSGYPSFDPDYPLDKDFKDFREKMERMQKRIDRRGFDIPEPKEPPILVKCKAPKAKLRDFGLHHLDK